MPETQPIPEAVLEIVEPKGPRRKVRVTATPFLIGRTAEAGNHLQLNDTRISRNCAAVVYAEGTFRVEDRGQRHGVFVNGERITARALREGDAINFGVPGSFELIFHGGEGPAGEGEEKLATILSRLDQTSTLGGEARELRHLSLLLEATTLLQSQLPLEEVLGAMVDRALALTDADRGLLLEAGDKGDLRPMVARQRGGGNLPPDALMPSQTAIKRALEEKRSVVELDVSQAGGNWRGAQSIVAQQLRSLVAIPLLSLAQPRSSEMTFEAPPARLLGLLYLDSRHPAAFSKIERQILDTLAVEAGSVLDKARLMQKEREQQRLEQEVETARQIQQALLPKSFQHFPHFQVTGVNQPCLAVGGDYFDVMELEAGRTGFLIADVCGKGLGAALLTAILQGTFSAMAMALGQELARVCAHINRFICSRADLRRYSTLFFGVLDTAGRLEFINAGHLPPLLVRDGRVESVFRAGSLPIGLLPDTQFETAAHTLEPGDTLVLFTDGISEAENAQGEQFGLERLREVVARHAAGGIGQLQAGVLAALGEFTGGEPQADDITLLILRYTGAPAGAATT